MEGGGKRGKRGGRGRRTCVGWGVVGGRNPRRSKNSTTQVRPTHVPSPGWRRRWGGGWAARAAERLLFPLPGSPVRETTRSGACSDKLNSSSCMSLRVGGWNRRKDRGEAPTGETLPVRRASCLPRTSLFLGAQYTCTSSSSSPNRFVRKRSK